LNLGRDFAEAMRQYGELFRETPLTTFGAVLDRYMNEITPKKAPRTQTDERGYIATLRSVFGDMAPRSITPGDRSGGRLGVASCAVAIPQSGPSEMSATASERQRRETI
jgi:hypothetical protein